MSKHKKNYYGSLCTELYELLHQEVPEDELDFYLSYAEKGKKILEPLCGSGRFLVPFLQRGFDISGIDLSGEMLNKLKEKAPNARVVQADVTEYCPDETFDYIFISSNSVSLFTDMDVCRKILRQLKSLLAPKGKLVFAVDTIANQCPNDSDYNISVSIKTDAGLDLVLKSKNTYDEASQTQFSPGIYELYQGATLLQREEMDFQTHLYRFGEMEQCLAELGFPSIKTYSTFSKDIAVDNRAEMFLFECSI